MWLPQPTLAVPGLNPLLLPTASRWGEMWPPLTAAEPLHPADSGYHRHNVAAAADPLRPADGGSHRHNMAAATADPLWSKIAVKKMCA